MNDATAILNTVGASDSVVLPLRNYRKVEGHIDLTMTKDMNTKMKEVAPELESQYAKYPLKRDRWFSLSEKDPEGKPIFVSLDGTTETMKDYVRGRGPRGEGFYHLLNQHAYKNLHQRLRNQAPAQCCACTKTARQYYNEYSDVQTVVYNRSIASIPDDGVGAKEAIAIARDTAQSHYHATQNEQLVIGVVQAATR